MLYKSSIQQADYLLSEFTITNKRLQLAQGSPIIPLVHSITTLNETGDNESLYQASLLVNTTEGTHGELEDVYEHKLSSILSNVVNTAKNKINPLIRDILAKIEEARQLAVLSSVQLLGDIKMVDTPRLFLDDYFIDLIKNYSLTAPSRLGNYFYLINAIKEHYDETELKQLIQTNITNLDTKLAEFVKDDFGIYGYKSVDYTNQLSLREAALLFFVIIALEKSEQLPVISDNPNAELNLVELKASLGGYLYRTSELLKSVLTAGELIVRPEFKPDDVGKVLFVYTETYKRWLQAGGSPEAALGYLAVNGNQYSYAGDMDLQKNPDKYFKEYQIRLERANAQNTIDDVTLTRNTTRNYLASYIAQSVDVDKEVLQKRLSENIQREYYGVGQTVEFVTKVVCRTFTKGDEVKNLLMEIDAVLKAIDTSDKEKALEKAVYLAVIRLTARWLKSNLIIVSN